MRYLLALALYAAAACTGAHPSAYGVTVTVVNAAPQPVSVSWHSPEPFGLPFLGTSGSQPVEACTVYITVFEPGSYVVTIDTGVSHRAFDVTAPSGEMVTLNILVQPGPTITEVDGASLPPSPYCS